MRLQSMCHQGAGVDPTSMYEVCHVDIRCPSSGATVGSAMFTLRPLPFHPDGPPAFAEASYRPFEPRADAPHVVLPERYALCRTNHENRVLRKTTQRHITEESHPSWLNQVEIWFSRIERHVIARGVFTSKADLARKLMRYIRAFNRTATSIKWICSNPSTRIALIGTSTVTEHYASAFARSSSMRFSRCSVRPRCAAKAMRCSSSDDSPGGGSGPRR